MNDSKKERVKQALDRVPELSQELAQTAIRTICDIAEKPATSPLGVTVCLNVILPVLATLAMCLSKCPGGCDLCDNNPAVGCNIGKRVTRDTLIYAALFVARTVQDTGETRGGDKHGILGLFHNNLEVLAQAVVDYKQLHHGADPYDFLQPGLAVEVRAATPAGDSAERCFSDHDSYLN